MEKQQTVVEWLFSKLSEQGTLYLEDFKQAKEMFEDQILKAHFAGAKEIIIQTNQFIETTDTLKGIIEIEHDISKYKDGKDYINETFKSE